MKLDNNEATLNYKRNLSGFDINISSNYSLMSEIPEYGINLELRNTFLTIIKRNSIVTYYNEKINYYYRNYFFYY